MTNERREMSERMKILRIVEKLFDILISRFCWLSTSFSFSNEKKKSTSKSTSAHSTHNTRPELMCEMKIKIKSNLERLLDWRVEEFQLKKIVRKSDRARLFLANSTSSLCSFFWVKISLSVARAVNMLKICDIFRNIKNCRLQNESRKDIENCANATHKNVIKSHADDNEESFNPSKDIHASEQFLLLLIFIKNLLSVKNRIHLSLTMSLLSLFIHIFIHMCVVSSTRAASSSARSVSIELKNKF